MERAGCELEGQLLAALELPPSLAALHCGDAGKDGAGRNWAGGKRNQAVWEHQQ